MDLALAGYLKDKKQYLKDFASGKFPVNSVLIGLVLSYSQLALKDDLDLIASLEKLIFDVHDNVHRSYCIAKFFKSVNDYLLVSVGPDPRLLQIFSRVGTFLCQFSIIPALTGVISENFSETLAKLFKICCRSASFGKIYKIGRLNINYLKVIPKIYELNLDEEIESISSVYENTNLNLLFDALFKICGKLKSTQVDFPETKTYISMIIGIIFKERLRKEAFKDFSMNISEFLPMFNQENATEILAAQQEASRKFGIDKPPQSIGLLGSEGLPSKIFSRSAVESPFEKVPQGFQMESQQKPLGSPDPNSFPVPNFDHLSPFHGPNNSSPPNQALYQVPPNQNINRRPNFSNLVQSPKNVPNQMIFSQHQNALNLSAPIYNPNPPISGADHPSKIEVKAKQMIKIPLKGYENKPNSSSHSISELKQVITDIITESFNLWITHELIELSEMKKTFEDFSKYTENFAADLESILKNMIDTQVDGKSLEFWRLVIQNSENFLNKSSITYFNRLLSQFSSKREDNEMKNVMARRGNSRGVRNRPSSRNNYGFRGSMHNFINYEDYEEEEKVLDQSSDFSSWAKDKVEFFPKGNENSLDLKPIKQKSNPGYNVSEPVPKKNSLEQDMQGLSIEESLSLMSADLKVLINKARGGYNEIIMINELVSEIKQFIKQLSPSANIRLVGSSAIGTYLKNTEVDLVYLDFLNPNLSNLLITAISSQNLGSTQDLGQTIIFSPKSLPFTFRFIINDDLVLEFSALIKEYCALDPRCTELIIIVKLWARAKCIMGLKMFTGIHLTLLVISFLQCCDPKILPNLQEIPPDQRQIPNVNTWFDTKSDFQSRNSSNIGSLFQLFLSFLLDLSKSSYMNDIKQGCVYEFQSDYLFSACNPFTFAQISVISKNSAEASKILQIVSETFELISTSKSLDKIINFA